MKEAICFLTTLLSMGETGATVVVMSETGSITIIFAFSRRWGFVYFIWPTASYSLRKFMPEITIFAFFGLRVVGTVFFSIFFCFSIVCYK